MKWVFEEKCLRRGVSLASNFSVGVLAWVHSLANADGVFVLCYRLKLFLEPFGVPSCVLNSELPVNSR